MSSESAIAEGPGQAVLLATKLHVPAVRHQLVHRTTLLAAISAAGGRKLTLVSAPAGWGKTTLLAQWVRDMQDDHEYAWLSLDTSDNDPVWFWMYMIAALQTVSPGVGHRASELLAMGADPVHVVLPTLLNELDTVTTPIVLVLDDYHLVTSRAVHEQMALVLSRMPVNLHLVLATRSDPQLPLARLRAAGDLIEVRTDDLRFLDVEAAQLLNDVLGLELTEPNIQLLYRRTEGWAAGLYLAALSLVGHPDTATLIKNFAGDNRHIVDYLMAEVLDSQPPPLRSFLLRSSVSERLSGPLCDAMLQSTGSASVLETIEQENLFLVPLDLSRDWYRFHHLFAELLRTELKRSEPELIPDLHRRVAAWFEAEGLIDEAVRHFVAAGDITRSADLIYENWVVEFNGGGLSTVSGWLDLLPLETVSQDTRLCAVRAWIALNTGQFDDARVWIETLEARLAARTPDHGSTDAQLAALRGIYSFKTGDITVALERLRHAITLDFDGASQARSGANCIYGSALYFTGNTDEAQTTFLWALQWAERIGDRRRRIYALGYLALIAAERGQLADAEQRIREATGSGTDLAGGEHFVNAVVSLAAATVLDARGDTAAAADAAHLSIVQASKGGGTSEIAKALLLRAKVLEDVGDHPDAESSRKEAGMLLERCATGDDASLHAAVGLDATTMAHDTGPSVGDELTAKELQLLELLDSPLTRREISQRLYISLNTVKSRQRTLYRKLGAEDRNAAVRRAQELGLL
jgi:LuxR family transcriptional regulator, maltose regulon positive regulatory protein